MTKAFDLTKFDDKSGFVLHFGGRPNEVDAYTFAHSLVAFSNVFQEINSQVNPDRKIELKLEGMGAGSFRGKIKAVSSKLAGKLNWSKDHVIVPLLLAFIYDNYISSDDVNITVSGDQVLIEHNGRTIIIPKTSYEAARSLPSPDNVHEQMNKTIDAMEDDPSITSLGVTLKIDDDKPALDLPRDGWEAIRSYRGIIRDDEDQKTITEEAVLSIVKVVFSKSRRKWEFVWRGIKISAYIDDPAFMASLMQSEIKVGNGDALKCIIQITQKMSKEHNVWINTDYSVAEVVEFMPLAKVDNLL